MSELQVEQKAIITQYKDSHTGCAKLSDEQVISIMMKDEKFKASLGNKVSIFTNTEHNESSGDFTNTKTKTISLKSGKKVIINSDGTKYFTKEGKEISKTEFEKTEGEIDIRSSGRYTVTKNGKTRYYALDGTEIKETYFKKTESPDVLVKSSDGKTYNFNKTFEKRLEATNTKLNKALEENGYIGKSWDFIKNSTGIGDSSDDVRTVLKEEKKLLEQFNSNPEAREKVFKELTGQNYTQENLEKFIKGEIKLRSEKALTEYKEGQEMAADVVSDVVSGTVAFTVATVAVAAAPVTGGTSLLLGAAVGASVGAGIKVGVKAADAATSESKEYTLNDAGKDAIIGGAGGAIAPISAGVGGAAFKVTSKLGSNFIAKSAQYAAEGALFGSVDGGTRAAVEGKDLEEIAVEAGKGAAIGAVAGNIIGHGCSAAKNGVSKTKTLYNNLSEGAKVKEEFIEIMGEKKFKYYSELNKEIFKDKSFAKILKAYSSNEYSDMKYFDLQNYYRDISANCPQMKTVLENLSNNGWGVKDIQKFMQEIKPQTLKNMSIGEDVTSSITKLQEKGIKSDKIIRFLKMKIENPNISSTELLNNYTKRYSQHSTELKNVSSQDMLDEISVLIEDSGQTNISPKKLKDLLLNIKCEAPEKYLSEDELFLLDSDKKMYKELAELIDNVPMQNSETTPAYLNRLNKIREQQQNQKIKARLEKDKKVIESNYSETETPLDKIELTPEERLKYEEHKENYIKSAGSPSTRQGMGNGYWGSRDKIDAVALQNYPRYNSTKYFQENPNKVLTGVTKDTKYPPVIRYLDSEAEGAKFKTNAKIVSNFPEIGETYQAKALKCCFTTPIGSNENMITSGVQVEIHPLSESSKAHLVTGWGNEVRYGGNSKFEVIDKYLTVEDYAEGSEIKRGVKGFVILQET